MPPAGSLRLDSMVEEYRPSSDGTRLRGTGQFDVAVTSADGALGTFVMRKGPSSWMYSDDGYPATWWGWDRYPLRPLLKPDSRIQLVWGAGQLVWYVVNTNGDEFAFPAVHMGPVSIAPQGSSDWVKVEIKPYPVDAVFSGYAGTSSSCLTSASTWRHEGVVDWKQGRRRLCASTLDRTNREAP